MNVSIMFHTYTESRLAVAAAAILYQSRSQSDNRCSLVICVMIRGDLGDIGRAGAAWLNLSLYQPIYPHNNIIHVIFYTIMVLPQLTFKYLIYQKEINISNGINDKLWRLPWKLLYSKRERPGFILVTLCPK